MSASLERNRAPRSGVRWIAREAVRVIVSSRARAVVTVIAFVLSSWLGAEHDATTMHVRCAQHGELMDSGAPDTLTVTAAAPARELRVRAAPGDAVRGHEHCALSAATRASRVVPNPPSLAAARLAVAERAAAVVRVAVARDRARYRTAPKTSPPA